MVLSLHPWPTVGEREDDTQDCQPRPPMPKNHEEGRINQFRGGDSKRGLVATYCLQLYYHPGFRKMVFVPYSDYKSKKNKHCAVSCWGRGRRRN